VYRAYRGSATYSVWALIAANTLLFIAVLAHGDIIYTFGLQPSDWLERPWILLTSLFIHSNLWHIAANMISLYFFGRFLSMLTGEKIFLVIYFLGGIAGSLVYVLLASPYSIAIGASGAVFAIAGALAVMRPKLRVYIFPIPAPVPLWAAVVGGFVVISILPYVAWQAHLGGLVLGLTAGYFLRKRQRIIIF